MTDSRKRLASLVVRLAACRAGSPTSRARSASREATVSRVLNGKPGVSDSTREAVLTALDVLGYERPTKLRGERARLVGLVLPELQNPIFPAFAEVVGGALAQQGYTPVLCTQTAGGVSEADYVELLLQQQVSGIVFAGGNYAQRDATHEHYRASRRATCPPSYQRRDRRPGVPAVSCDDEVAVEQAMGHWLSLGHTQDRPAARARRTTCRPSASSAARVVAGTRRDRARRRPGRAQRVLARGRSGRRRPAARRPASPASSVPATRSRSARSGPSAGPGCGCRRTCRWSATTTRRS